MTEILSGTNNGNLRFKVLNLPVVMPIGSRYQIGDSITINIKRGTVMYHTSSFSNLIVDDERLTIPLSMAEIDDEITITYNNTITV